MFYFPIPNIAWRQVSRRILPQNQILLNVSPLYESILRTWFTRSLLILDNLYELSTPCSIGDSRCPILSSISSGSDIVRGLARNSTWTRANVPDNEGDGFFGIERRGNGENAYRSYGRREKGRDDASETIGRRKQEEDGISEGRQSRGIVSGRFFRVKRRRHLPLLRMSCNRKWERCGGSGKPQYAGRYW